MKNVGEKYKEFFAKISSTLKGENGQGLVEYGLLLVLIAVVVILMLKGTGQQVNSLYSRINSGLGQ